LVTASRHHQLPRVIPATVPGEPPADEITRTFQGIRPNYSGAPHHLLAEGTYGYWQKAPTASLFDRRASSKSIPAFIDLETELGKEGVPLALQVPGELEG
jgi:hypothetical protein